MSRLNLLFTASKSDLTHTHTHTQTNRHKLTFRSRANFVSTGLTCQKKSVCLFVCVCVCVYLSGLFFKASNWMIYWLLTVVLAPYLSNQVFRAWLSSATLRFFSLAEQCHTQKFYLWCFNSDFDAVKSKFGLLLE